jgi:hypothetical protein
VAAVLAAGAAPKLRLLNLGGNSIGDAGARALAAALPIATALESLDLSSNAIGSGGACALAQALPRAGRLAVLNLQSNAIGDEGTRALAGALPGLALLKELWLGGNLIGDEGACALAAVLPSAPALERLDLGRTRSAMTGPARWPRRCRAQRGYWSSGATCLAAPGLGRSGVPRARGGGLAGGLGSRGGAPRSIYDNLVLSRNKTKPTP